MLLPSIRTLICFVTLLVWQICDTYAQCPMCKASAESNLKEGGTTAMGLNTGILYLLVTPYLFIAVLGFLWWWYNIRGKKNIDSSSSNTH